MIVDIAAPDQESRTVILRAKALQQNLNLPPGRKGWESESVMHSRDVTRSESPAALLL